MINYIPYFYIVKHIPTQLLYAGAKWASDANPDTFMKIGGYTTSSKTVNQLIAQDGLESFKIIQLLTESECGINVYEYETWYLNKFNIAQRGNWLNLHNNDGYYAAAFGSENFKNLMMKIHGAENASQIKIFKERMITKQNELYGGYGISAPVIRQKFESTMNDRYGVSWAAQSPELLEKRHATNKKRYGSQCTLMREDISAKRKETWDAKYKNGQPLADPKVREKIYQTWNDIYGSHPMQNKDVLNGRKQTNLAIYGAEEITQSDYFKEKSKQTHLEKFGVDNYSKTPEKRALMSERLKDTISYNNGEKEIKIKPNENIPDGFVVGALSRRKRTDAECAATSKRQTGSTLWNDGIRNYQVALGETPQSHWVKGKVKKVKTPIKNKNTGCTVWNDGIHQYSVKPDDLPESHWVRGMLPRKKS